MEVVVVGVVVVAVVVGVSVGAKQNLSFGYLQYIYICCSNNRALDKILSSNLKEVPVFINVDPDKPGVLLL